MPREWRSIARFAAWRRNCATADDPRLVADATDAFVDRRPIDWASLLARVRTPRDRALFQNLRLLDRVRASRPDPSAPIDNGAPLRTVAGVLAALGAVQTAGCLGAVAVAVVTGDVSTVRAPQVLLAVSFAAASVLLAATIARDGRSLFLLAGFTGVASAFARAAAAGLPPAYGAWLAPIVRGLYPESFTPASVWLFAVEFPRVRRFTAFDRIARRLAVAGSVVGALLLAVNFADAYLALDSRVIANVRRNDPGNGFWTLFALVLMPALATIVVRARRADWIERRRLARFALALCAGSAPVLVIGLLRELVPPFGAWLSSAAPHERRWLDGVVLSALMATPILGTAALVVDRPFDRQEFLPPARRSAILRAAVQVAAAAPLAGVLATVYRRRHLPLGEAIAGSLEWWLVAWMAGGLLLLAMRWRLDGTPPRRRPVRATVHHDRLAFALGRIRTARGAAEISAILGDELRGIPGAETACVLMPAAAGAFCNATDMATPLEAGSALFPLLRESTRPLDCSTDGPLFTLLPSRDREWLTRRDLVLVGALTHRDGTIAAIVTLGPKRGARPFTRRDRWLVATLVSAASAAWEVPEHEGSIGSELAGDTVPSADRAAFECRRCGAVSDTRATYCGCHEGIRVACLPKRLATTLVVGRRLGAGRIGVVYQARDTVLRRDVALKALPHLGANTAGRVCEQARAVAGLSHESLATLYGIERWRDAPVLVMEYLPGGTLADTLAKGPLSQKAAVDIAIDLARALGYMHARGVLHLNLKPSNIGFAESGGAKLLDAGLAVLAGPAGPARYRPPEASRGARPSPAFDLWALSMVLAESAGGRAADLDALLGCALDRVAARRYRGATELLAALDALSTAPTVLSSK